MTITATETPGTVGQSHDSAVGMARHHAIIFLVLFALAVVAPFFLYPVFLMKVLCFALFACAFNLLLGFGVALAAFAGVLAADIYSVNPNMGADLIIVVFAVVVIGGMGSILGSVITGFGLGLVEGLTRVFYPEASNTVIFIIMAIVLMIRPAGLFGTAK